jgi:hypothetical protein
MSFFSHRQLTASLLTTALLVVAAACNNTSPTPDASQSTTSGSPSPSGSVAASNSASPSPSDSAAASNNNPNAIESDGIQLVFSPSTEANQTHVDVFVQKVGSREPIPTAKITMQVQTPNGQTQNIPVKYDAAGKHFGGVVPGAAAGQYQVKVSAVVDGKTLDGRFSFNR